ncbi:MAG: hypothetical protein LAP21_12730 [Acidobacteriia bacterium]|nr:hypothetical protein [Terriglobia bacterium]
MENYFNYFTEIEQHYQRRRGSGLLLSTLDWALIETWKEAGISLEAVLRGIDTAFDAWERRPKKTTRINSLAYCSQAVLAAAEDMKEAAVGTARSAETAAPGLEAEAIVKFLSANAARLRAIDAPDAVRQVAEQCAATLSELAESMGGTAAPLRLEDLERHLTVLEEKLLAAMTISAKEAELLAIRAQADREIATYRSKMTSAQIEQLMKQFTHKRLFELAKMPRLSLFYM